MECWTADGAKSGTQASRKRQLPSPATGVQSRRWCALAFSEAPIPLESSASGLDYLFLHRKPRVRENAPAARPMAAQTCADRKSTRLNSSHLGISYAVF